ATSPEAFLPAAGFALQNHTMQRSLITLGVIIVAIGLLWPWLGKLPLGRLPGDIAIHRPGFKLYFPITTMVLISLLISLVVWLFRK
ncbi:MAG: DUF2905 domain-containing protein, partial [Pseudomonadota bacterium]